MNDLRTPIRVAALTLCSLFVFVAPAAASWSLVWADEFNGTSLDAANWGYDIGNGCPSLCGWGNAELQYYRSQNVSVSGGNLALAAKAESFAGYQFTSGKITTRNLHSFQYGRVEMRAKIPTGGGMWPAFWMLPQNSVYGTWAASGEIDIMEASNATDVISGTIHYGGAYPANTFSGGNYSLGALNFGDDFHVYAIEWEPDVMRWYVDGVLYSTKTSAQWYTNAAPGSSRAPFDQPFYLLLNAAVGGNFTGCTSPACISASLPQEFLVDYVRVFQDIPNALPTVAITTPAPGATVPTGKVTIQASASDSDGSVAKVEFYDGFDFLGEDTTAPYEFVWNGVTDGCYQVMVRVIDNQGGTNTDSVDLTVGTGCGQSPFAGTAPDFPGRIEAEDYDDGGEGIAYHDIDAANNGGQYRPAESVDIETSSDVGGGFNIGWLALSEWVEYTVNVRIAGVHGFDVRVASQNVGGSFHLEFGGANLTGDINVPVTGGWQTWTTVSFSANLPVGTQVMRFVPTSGEFNVNWFEVVSAPTPAPPARPGELLAGLESYPNPFNPRTTIRFELGEAAVVDIDVFDAQGRRVRGITAGTVLEAGVHALPWDGRDDAGRVVSGGVYFARAQAGQQVQTIRMVLLK